MVDEEARNAVGALNEHLGGMYKVDLVDPADLVPAPKNARFMTQEQFSSLVHNVQADGGLSSVPLCWRSRGKDHILSGHHRVKAAVEAGVNPILIFYTDSKLSKQERIARQLSHNAIEGQDDVQLLEELWSEIRDVELKVYSGLDDKTLEQLRNVTLPPLSPVGLEFRSLSFLFLPNEAERLDEVLAEALSLVTTKDVRAARMAEWDRTLNAISEASDSFDVRNIATALGLVLDVYEAHRTDLSEGWQGEEDAKHKGWVPLSTIFGGDRVPAGAAMTIKRALSTMEKREDIGEKNRWQFIEFLAAEYLAAEGGPDDG